jgi:hypothetical protein
MFDIHHKNTVSFNINLYLHIYTFYQQIHYQYDHLT